MNTTRMNTLTMLRQMMRVACAATLFFAASTAQAATISLTPSSAAVTAGDTFSIDIMASDVNLGGFDLWVGFQPGRVSAVGDPQFFGFLGAPESFQMSSTEIDVVKLAEVSFVTNLSDLTALQGTAPGNSFRLARLQFKADMVGVASFDFLFDDLTDLNGRPVLADLSGTSVTIAGPQEPPPAETPEPATMMLGGVGLAVALGMRRFRGK